MGQIQGPVSCSHLVCLGFSGFLALARWTFRTEICVVCLAAFLAFIHEMPLVTASTTTTSVTAKCLLGVNCPG